MNELGQLGVSWLDRREDVYTDGPDDIPDTADDDDVMNQAYRVYFDWSGDGGDSWYGNTPISSLIDPRAWINYPLSQTWSMTSVSLGRYRSMAGFGRNFLPVWVDLRDWPDAAVELRHQPQYAEDPFAGQTLGDIFGCLIEIVEPVRGSADFDLDCDVDLTDFAAFAQCFGGSGNPPPGTCPVGLAADIGGAEIPTSDARAKWYLMSGEIAVPDEPGYYTVTLNPSAVLVIRSDVDLNQPVTDGYVVEAVQNGDVLVGGSFGFQVLSE